MLYKKNFYVAIPLEKKTEYYTTYCICPHNKNNGKYDKNNKQQQQQKKNDILKLFFKYFPRNEITKPVVSK